MWQPMFLLQNIFSKDRRERHKDTQMGFHINDFEAISMAYLIS